MTAYRLTDSAPEPPPGYRAWNAAERARLAVLLAEVDAVTAAPAKARKSDASAKANNHGWDRIMATAALPAGRVRSVEDGRS